MPPLPDAAPSSARGSDDEYDHFQNMLRDGRHGDDADADDDADARAHAEAPVAPDEDASSVVAVNKYVGPDKDEARREKQPGGDVELAVRADGGGEEDAPAKQGAAAAVAHAKAPPHHHHHHYPPSFFTNERGNLKFVALVVRRPCALLTTIIVLCFVVAFALQALVFRTAAAEGGTPFTIPSNEFDLSDVRSVQYDSYRLARDAVRDARKARESAGKTVPRQSERAAIAYWVFEAADRAGGVFGSRESIEGMKDAYEIFLDDADYAAYCELDYRANLTALGLTEAARPCTPPLTPLSMYYASRWDEAQVQGVLDALADPARVELFNALALCVIRDQYCELLPADASPDDVAWARRLGRDVADITRYWDLEGDLVENYPQVTELAAVLMQLDVFKGTVDFGFDKEFSAENPVSQYSRGIVFWGQPLETRNTTSDEDSEEEYEKNEDDQRKDFIVANYLDEMNAQSEPGTHAEINSYYFMTSLIGDVILKIVTQDAMLAIFSFVFVVVWLRVNTRSWFLALIGFFEIFFSLPIAWFLFTVVFRIKYFATLNTLAIFIVAAIGADDIFIFMDAYKQSQYHPEILCDLETRMSWVYRRTGTAMAITSATTCAAFLCTLITPLTSLQSFGIFAAVVIFIDYVLVMSLFCTAVVIYHNRFENHAKLGCCCPCGPVQPTNTETARIAVENSDGEMKRDRVSEFFKTNVAGLIKMPMARLGFGVVFAVWLGCAIWQMTLLETTKQNEQFLDEDNPLQKSITILDQQFETADDDPALKIYYAWGLEEVDRTGVNRLLDPEFYGKPRYVADFDFNEQCQSDLLAFCDRLRTDEKYENLLKSKNGIAQVNCFIEELAAYNVKGNLEDCDYVTKGDWKGEAWQVDPADLPEIMPGLLKQKSCFDENRRDTVSGRYQNEIGWNGLEMKYAAISLESNVLDPFGLDAESVTRREYDQFVAIQNEQDDIVSKSCRGFPIMTDLDDKFTFMNNQVIYQRSAIQSSCLGVAIAFGVLLISTRVFHLAFFASLSIMSVLVSVVGTMVMIGWELGSIESTLIGIIAGFSVDYVVHLAHAYEIASGDTYARVTEAFSDLGISVFNGMITSVVASIPLFFCSLQFFAKFGTFLCLTIAYSWIFANFGFMSLLAQLKIPLKDTGCFRL